MATMKVRVVYASGQWVARAGNPKSASGEEWIGYGGSVALALGDLIRRLHDVDALVVVKRKTQVSIEGQA